MKTILLTGDSKGVGLQTLRVLIERGYKVIGLSRSIGKEGRSIAEKYPEQYIHINFDMSNSDEIKKLYTEFLKVHSPFHGYINNAAVAYDDIITNLNHDSLEKMYRVNVFAPMMITKYMLRDMLLRKTRGSIVHISSISAHTGYKGLAMYASTKGAMEAFSKNTAREWGSIGIRSNVVCPGFMETDMSASLSDSQKTRIYNRNSLKTPTDVQSVAQTIAFLLREESLSITGQIIHVDNGTI
jgi:3-oxoacyl-[acyl-carrier protein] reductase